MGRNALDVIARFPKRVITSYSIHYTKLYEVDRRAERRAVPKIRKETYGIDVDLGIGKGSYFVYFSDLGYDYIRINAGYRT